MWLGIGLYQRGEFLWNDRVRGENASIGAIVSWTRHEYNKKAKKAKSQIQRQQMDRGLSIIKEGAGVIEKMERTSPEM